jgi:hypothetical protein
VGGIEFPVLLAQLLLELLELRFAAQLLEQLLELVAGEGAEPAFFSGGGEVEGLLGCQADSRVR